jgi:hypothetical protein
LFSFNPYDYVRIKVEKPLLLAVVFMGVELRHIVQKKYEIMWVCEKSAGGSAMSKGEGWKKLHSRKTDNVLRFI